MKVAVIGAGTMGGVHSEAYQNMDHVDLVGIVDFREEAANRLADKRDTRGYTSLEELLEKEDPDLVDVCVPTYEHRHYVEKIAKAKKHIICEKPIAGNLEDARAMIQICQDEGVRLFIAQVVRFFPEFRKAYDLLAQEAIGQVGTVRTMRGGVFPRGWNDWYANTEKSGSLIVDLMIHDLDFLRWCFGEVERVFAKSLMGRETNRLDHALVSLRFKNGVIAHCQGSWAYPEGFRTELEIAGSTGIIQHNSEEAVPIKVSKRSVHAGSGSVAIPESPLVQNPYYHELAHFIDCIQHNQEPLVHAEDAYQALEIALAAVKSVRTGEAVTL